VAFVFGLIVFLIVWMLAPVSGGRASQIALATSKDASQLNKLGCKLHSMTWQALTVWP
jgi:hypothetical protein